MPNLTYTALAGLVQGAGAGFNVNSITTVSAAVLLILQLS